jgi:hypothetical protein
MSERQWDDEFEEIVDDPKQNPIQFYEGEGVQGLGPRACYELGRKSHRNADSTVGLVPSRSPFSAYLSRF